MRLSVFALMLPLTMAACKSEHSRTVEIDEAQHVTMSLSGMFSLQSDWERRLTIHDGDEAIEVELLSDTGWWRGSGLYLHNSGLYVLNEGQGGCVVFQASPPKIIEGRAQFCDRAPKGAEPDTSVFQSNACVPSRFYSDLCFVGLFFEAEGLENAMQFNGSGSQKEKLLPTPP